MARPHYWLVMPAAGRGQRLAADLPKQYLPLAGRSMLEWSLQPFLADPSCRGIAVAVSAHDAHWANLRARLPSRVIEAPGGRERSDSVRQALATLRAAGADDADWVLVHDAARPCVTRAEIDSLLDTVANDATAGQSPLGGGILALPLADTLKREVEGTSGDTISREGLWRALTPQMFRLGALLAALNAAEAEARLPTDEAQAIEWQGGRPRLVVGQSTNLKVTTAADLALAEGILRARNAAGGGQ